jgi:hypothetical protein
MPSSAGWRGAGRPIRREGLGSLLGGPPAEFVDEALSAEIARLDELKDGAVERRIEADLVLGRYVPAPACRSSS